MIKIFINFSVKFFENVWDLSQYFGFLINPVIGFEYGYVLIISQCFIQNVIEILDGKVVEFIFDQNEEVDSGFSVGADQPFEIQDFTLDFCNFQFWKELFWIGNSFEGPVDG